VCLLPSPHPKVGYNLFNRQARHILALSCCPRLLLYYKWLWNIYKHHKFNLCRRCARRVYCAHNKRSTEIPSRPNSTGNPPPVPSRFEVIYYFYTFHAFVRHALSTLYNIQDIVRKLLQLLLIFIMAFFAEISCSLLQITINWGSLCYICDFKFYTKIKMKYFMK